MNVMSVVDFSSKNPQCSLHSQLRFPAHAFHTFGVVSSKQYNLRAGGGLFGAPAASSGGGLFGAPAASSGGATIS